MFSQSWTATVLGLAVDKNLDLVINQGVQADDVAGVELEELLHALEAARDGNFSLRLPAAGSGIGADLRKAFNQLVKHAGSLYLDAGKSSCGTTGSSVASV